MQRSSADLNSVMRRWAKLVYSLAYARTQNHADAEDIFQEVFLKLAQSGEPFRDEEHEKAWLIKVTANLSTNLVRSAWRRHVTLRDYLPEHRNIPAADEEPSALDAAMRRLREKDRLVLYLRYYEQMGTEEIGRVMGMSVPTVRMRISRARKALQGMMTELEKEDRCDVRDQI